MKYIETEHEFIYAGNDGELYTSYYPGYTKKRTSLKKGMKTVTIRVRGNKKYISVAKEIGIAFLPNPNGYRYVKEVDGDISNTSIGNLVWSKSNRMDYNAFAKKKTGMLYKSFTGDVIGDYKVIGEDNGFCQLSCLRCGDEKSVERSCVSSFSAICYMCKDKSLDIGTLNSVHYREWDIIGEYGTDNIMNRGEKSILIKCKCCSEENIISYPSYLSRKSVYRCKFFKTIRKKAYTALKNIKARCYNKNCKSYKDYGAKGITVCSGWSEDSSSFIEWSLDNGIAKELTIDRMDNNGNYEPSNCRWVSSDMQNQNQSTTLLNEDLVLRIKNTDWGSMDNRMIADELGIERISGGNAIGHVLRGSTWKNIN